MPKRIPIEIKNKVKALYEAGYSIPEIATSCPEVSPSGIRKWRDTEGWVAIGVDFKPFLLPAPTTEELPLPETIEVPELLQERLEMRRTEQAGDNDGDNDGVDEIKGDKKLIDFTRKCDELLVHRGLALQLETIYKFEHAIYEGLSVVLNDPISYVKELNLLSQVYERICKERRIIHGTANEIIRLEVSNLDTETLQKLATVDV